MKSRITINGHTFKLDEDNNMYECRGEVMYDDEHDEMPEPTLWDASCKLAEQLKEDGHKAQPSHSEKGWCEVQIIN